MTASRLGFGIVGTGMIAGVIADSIAASTNAELIAVSGRRIDTARHFADTRPGVAAVQGHDALIARTDVAAVYVATPTVAKEDITLAAIAAGKHVLVDKPFMNAASLLRMTQAAAAKGVAFMDATHFVHHPRTAAIKNAAADTLGAPRSLHTAFYFPFSERTNIRFDTGAEPMGAVGDMAWYSMRAVVEYLRPRGHIVQVAAVPERDPQTGAVIQASGLIAFDGGEVSTFDVGYTAGTILMDLQLLGTKGVVAMDDFVLDWTNSFAFKNSDIMTGYSHRTGLATRKDVRFVSTPSGVSGDVAMIQAFAELAVSGNASRRAEWAGSALKTQEYLDAIWASAVS